MALTGLGGSIWSLKADLQGVQVSEAPCQRDPSGVPFGRPRVAIQVARVPRLTQNEAIDGVV